MAFWWSPSNIVSGSGLIEARRRRLATALGILPPPLCPPHAAPRRARAHLPAPPRVDADRFRHGSAAHRRALGVRGGLVAGLLWAGSGAITIVGKGGDSTNLNNRGVELVGSTALIGGEHEGGPNTGTITINLLDDPGVITLDLDADDSSGAAGDGYDTSYVEDTAAIGIALNARRLKSDYRTYVLLGRLGRATDDLQKASHAMAEQLYIQQASGSGPQASGQPDDVMDGEVVA